MKTRFFILSLFFVLQACANPGDTSPEDEADPSAAPDFTLETLDHGTFRLAAQRGKVVYVYFVGFNCPPCIAASPEVEKDIVQVYDAGKLTVIGVDVWDGTIGQLANFKIQTGVTFPLGLTGSGVGALYGATVDYSVLINKKGQKVYENSGANISLLKQKIDELLKE